MSKETYCIFEVYDYKGGELSSSVNLSKEDFISELAEKFDSLDYNDPLEINNVKSKINECLKDEDEFYSEYAGGDGFVGEMYVIENNKMKGISFGEYVDDIAEYIIKNWNE